MGLELVFLHKYGESAIELPLVWSIFDWPASGIG